MLHFNFFNGGTFIQGKDGREGHWAYDWYVRDSFEMPFSEFKDFLAAQVPNVYPKKELARLWNFTIVRPDAPVSEKTGLVMRNNRAAFDGVSALVLDFDGGLSVDEFIEGAQGLSYVLHTTYSHQSARKGGADCFRAVVELSEPIPWDLLEKPTTEHGSILPALSALWPLADPTCFQPQRAHYLPSLPEDKWPFRCHRGDGEPLSWQELEVTPPLEKRTYTPVVTTTGGSGKLLRHTLDLDRLFTDRGWIRSSRGDVQLVECPNEISHGSKDDATKLLNMSGRWNFKCHHSHCGGTKWVIGHLFSTLTEDELRPYCETKIEGVQFVPKLPAGDGIDEPEGMEGAREEVRPDTRTFYPPMPVPDRVQLLKAALRHKHAVIRTAEGFGKSTIIVRELLQSGKSVLFCTASNTQANSKMQDFELFSPQRVWSLAGLMMQEVGIKPVHEAVSHSWDEAPIDEEATIARIAEHSGVDLDTAADLLLNWQQMAKASRRLHSRLAITTFATGSSMKRIEGHLGMTIVVDDPSTGDLQTEMWDYVDDLAVMSKQRPINDVVFGTVSGGMDQVIWTTTEKLVTETIRFQHPDVQVVEVEENLRTENVLMVPTPLTRKRLKKVLPGIAKYAWKRAKQEFEVIGNGMGSEVNLVSSKGRNDLNYDQMVVISYPHPLEVMGVTSSMGLEEHERQRVMRQMVIDVTNQIIGRTQGYRHKGSKLLLLVDPRLEVSLRHGSRYELPSLERYRHRGLMAGYPLVWYDEMPQWWGCVRLCLETWEQYVIVLGDRAIWLDRSEDGYERLQEVQRMLTEPVRDLTVHWKLKHELVEGEGRRNYNLVIRELIEEREQMGVQLEEKRRQKVGSLLSERNKELNKERTGKVRYISPTGERKFFTTGTQPHGWTTTSRKARPASSTINH